MSQKLYQHQFFKNYLLYCLCYVLVGMTFVAIGPLLPYYAQKQNKDISYYSPIIIVRSIGYISGSFFIKLTQKYIGFHKSLILGLFLSGVFNFCFDLTENLIARSVFIYFGSFGIAYIDIYSNISTIQSFKERNFQGQLQFLHGCAGLGGLIIPLLVLVFTTKTYMFLGLVSISIIPIVWILNSPQEREQDPNQSLITSQQQSQTYKDSQLANVNSKLQQKPQAKPPIPLKPFVLLCFLFFLSLGIQAGYGNWVSSYAVIRDYASKDDAALYSTVFWLSITLARFVFAFIPGMPSLKIKIVSLLGLVFTLVFSFVIFDTNPNAILITASALIGICDASIFALLQSLSLEYDFQPQQKQTSTFMLFAGIGEGSTAGFVGFMLGVTVPQIVFYTAAGIFLFIFINTFITECLLKREKQICEVKLVSQKSDNRKTTQSNITL